MPSTGNTFADAYAPRTSGAARVRPIRRRPFDRIALLAESAVPLMHDPNTPSGRAALGLDADDEFAGTRVARLRLRPGDEASCLTLYQPANPRIVGVNPADFAIIGAPDLNHWLYHFRPNACVGTVIAGRSQWSPPV